ncbi:hypothetical protein ACQP2F_18400 [Actinoplanes sp. CA-030573]|uniref:hypothetical protein n=1 Tax=Actinoplanes sp. CA-030573 TaxID=3239898 RepID=UPI003D89D2EF
MASAAAGSAPAGDDRRPAATARARSGRADAAALVSYLALAAVVTRNLWADPGGRELFNRDDHGFFLVMIAHGERVLFHGESPLFTTRLNAPAGVNLMANTSMPALTIPLAPITHAFGPAVTFAVLLTAGLAGTAAAWWWLLSRQLVGSRPAAWTGGLWAGFAPGVLAHANGQVNLVSGYVIPFIAGQVIRLREPGRVWRGGVLLGLLTVLQAFVNEETLLLAALAMVLIVAGYALMNRPDARDSAGRFLAGAAVAAGVAGVLLAYPLYWQFFGPGHYRGLPFGPDLYATTLGAVVAYSPGSIAGGTSAVRQFGGSITEAGTFWGPVACLMIVVSAVLARRSAAARATALAGLILLTMSFGSRLRPSRAGVSIPAPFGWVGRTPVLNLVTTPRYALAATALAGVLLALGADQVRRRPALAHRAFWTGMALALVPLFPRALPVTPAPAVPAFFADRMWRPYLRPGQSVVIVPLPAMTTGRDGMRLAALSHLAFRVPRGYFLGPADPPVHEHGSWRPPPRYASTLLAGVGRFGFAPYLTAAARRAVLSDLRYWRAGVVVLLPGAPHRAALWTTLTRVLGLPLPVGGVDVWRLPPSR